MPWRRDKEQASSAYPSTTRAGQPEKGTEETSQDGIQDGSQDGREYEPRGIARRRGPSPVAIAVALVGLVALGGAGLTVGRNRIEDDLTRRTQTALQRAGIRGAVVNVDGRDVSVAVPGDRSADEVRSVINAAGVEGIRSISVSSIDDVAAAPVPTVPSRPTVVSRASEPTATFVAAAGSSVTAATTPTGVIVTAPVELFGGVRAAVDGEVVVLTGIVPDGDTMQSMVAAAAGQSRAAVVNQLEFDPVVAENPTQMVATARVAALLRDAGARTGDASLLAGVLTLRGRVPTLGVRTAVFDEAVRLMGSEDRVVNGITITPEP